MATRIENMCGAGTVADSRLKCKCYRYEGPFFTTKRARSNTSRQKMRRKTSFFLEFRFKRSSDPVQNMTFP